MNDYEIAKTLDAINDLLKPLLADGFLTAGEALTILDVLAEADTRKLLAVKAAALGTTA